MGRSGYIECDDWDSDQQYLINLHQGARASALRGKRGQAFLRRLAAALDAMPVKALCAIPDDGEFDHALGKYVPSPGEGSLGLPTGEVCVLGSLARVQGLDPTALDATDHDALAKLFNVSQIIVRDLEWENDQRYSVGPAGETEDEARWRHLRDWVQANTIDAPAAKAGA